MDAAASVPDLNGLWLLEGFEDPIAIDLRVTRAAQGYQVTGRGCIEGPDPLFRDAACPLDGPTFYDACGDLSGAGAGPDIQFAFDFPVSGETLAHGADIYAAQDGTRMAGGFFYGTGTGDLSLFDPALPWVRLAALGYQKACDSFPTPPTDTGPVDLPALGLSSQPFVLQGGQPVGRLVPGQRYRMRSVHPGVLSGELGAFWNPDFHWNAATRTLTAGPVPETVPGLPVRLDLSVSDAFHVTAVVATTADGRSGTLLPVAP
jgi:hypothetical protein